MFNQGIFNRSVVAACRNRCRKFNAGAFNLFRFNLDAAGGAGDADL